MINITVIGLGYIGLPTAVMLASNGANVYGLDINKKIIDDLNQGLAHINEKFLQDLLIDVLKNQRFKANITPVKSDAYLIAVPTPFLKENNSIPVPDTSFIFNAIDSITSLLVEGDLIVIESTSPVGTTEKIYNHINHKTGLTKEEIHIAYCPERVLPGNILFELKNNDRVIGGLTKEASKKALNIYKLFCKGEHLLTDSKTAELVKLTENAYRDVNIAFANEISLVCEDFNINPYSLIDLANYHPRVNILKPGCGVGGHCIAVDPWFIASQLPNSTNLIQSARRVNDNKPNWIISKVKEVSSKLEIELGRKPIIGCLGLAFKPDVEDLRESPALYITLSLIESGLNIIACEPNLNDHKSISLVSLEDIIVESDLLVCLVAHSSFFDQDFKNKRILNFCGL